MKEGQREEEGGRENERGRENMSRRLSQNAKELVAVTGSNFFSVSFCYHLIAVQHLVINIACPTPTVQHLVITIVCPSPTVI